MQQKTDKQCSAVPATTTGSAALPHDGSRYDSQPWNQFCDAMRAVERAMANIKRKGGHR